MSDKYVVIAEFKEEQPTIMEQSLASADIESAHARMKALATNPQVIRVAMARLVYQTGNETLIPKVEV